MAINLGLTAISDLKLGSTQVDKVYLGSTEVWSTGTDPFATDWGILYYYPYTISYEIMDAMECEAEITDPDLLESYISQQEDTGMMGFMYEESQGGWMYAGSETVITTEDMPTTTGITVTLNEGSPFAEIMIERSVSVDTSATPTEVTLTESEYESLTGDMYSIGGTNIPRQAIKAFIFGIEATTTPQAFLQASSVEQISFEYAENLTSIGGNFLSGCSSFNQSLDLSSVTSIGAGFLHNCTSFNQPITIPNAVTSIGDMFLSGCRSFNQPIDIPNTVTSIGISFLYNCTSFNQPLDLSNVTSIGDMSLSGCSSFNQSLDLSSVTYIGSDFLQGCTSFNQSLDLSSVTTIGAGLLHNCTSFNQDFTIPASVTSIYGYFMYNCNSMTSTVYCNAPATVATTSNYTLATPINTAPCYTTGITLAGTYASGWKTRFPNRSSSPYRKLILAS